MASRTGFFPTSLIPERAPAALPRVNSFPVRARLTEDNELAATAEDDGSSEGDDAYGSEAESFLSRSEIGESSSYGVESDGDDDIRLHAGAQTSLERVASMPRARLSRDEEEVASADEEGSFVESAGEESAWEDDGGFVSSARVVTDGVGVERLAEAGVLSSTDGGLEDAVGDGADELNDGLFLAEEEVAVADGEAGHSGDIREENGEAYLLKTLTVDSTSVGREERLESYMLETSDAGSTTSGDSTDCTDICVAVVGELVETAERSSLVEESKQTTKEMLETEDGLSAEYITSNEVANEDDSCGAEPCDETFKDSIVEIVSVDIHDGISPCLDHYELDLPDSTGSMNDAQEDNIFLEGAAPGESGCMQESTSLASPLGRTPEDDKAEVYKEEAKETESEGRNQVELPKEVYALYSNLEKDNDKPMQSDDANDKISHYVTNTMYESVLDEDCLALHANKQEIPNPESDNTHINPTSISETMDELIAEIEEPPIPSCQPNTSASKRGETEDADHKECMAEKLTSIEPENKFVPGIVDSNSSVGAAATLAVEISTCSSPEMILAAEGDSLGTEPCSQTVKDSVVDIAAIDIDNGISPGSGYHGPVFADAKGSINNIVEDVFPPEAAAPSEFLHMQELASFPSALGRIAEDDKAEAYEGKANETESNVKDRRELLNELCALRFVLENENGMLIQRDDQSYDTNARSSCFFSENSHELVSDGDCLPLLADNQEIPNPGSYNNSANVTSTCIRETRDVLIPAIEVPMSPSCQVKTCASETGETEVLVSNFAEFANLQNSETAQEYLNDLGEGSLSSSSDLRISQDVLHSVHNHSFFGYDGEKTEAGRQRDGGDLFGSNTLTALLTATRGASSDGTDAYGTLLASNNSLLNPGFAHDTSINLPTRSGSAVPFPKSFPTHPTTDEVSTVSGPITVAAEHSLDEEHMKLHEEINVVRVKFLRLVKRLDCSLEDSVALQVLHRLGLAEEIKTGIRRNPAFNINCLKQKALQLEENGANNLDFTCNILVLGKCGVGKSATINSIFGKNVTATNAFAPGTTRVRQIAGVVNGITIRLIDTPGLKLSLMDQSWNVRMLSSIRKSMKTYPPDVVLYIDRLDMPGREIDDMQLLRSVSDMLGSSIWSDTIIVLSHAAAAYDDPNGALSSYDTFVTQRSHSIQHSIRQAARNFSLVIPVSLVENHHSCEKNLEGQPVLPNGRVWGSQLLLLCYSCKILSEANSLLKLNGPYAGRNFGFRLPLLHFLSTFFQSRRPPK